MSVLAFRRPTLSPLLSLTLLASRATTAAPLSSPRPSSTLASCSAPWSPAHPGDLISSVDTPALLLDMDAFDANCLALRTRLFAARGKNPVLARPHAKALKCAPLVQRSLELLGPDAAQGGCAQVNRRAEYRTGSSP